MKKKIVYIAHPIGGDVEGNLIKIQQIYKEIAMNMPAFLPFCPYYATVMSLDDSDQGARHIGMSHNYEIFKSGIIDQVWLYGDRISAGMTMEIGWAYQFNIPVISMTEGTKPC